MTNHISKPGVSVLQSEKLKESHEIYGNIGKKTRNAIYGMYIITALNFLSMSLFSPLINKQVRELQVSPFIMGIVGTVYGLMGLVSTPTVMSNSNIYGARRLFIFCLITTFIVNAIQGGTSVLLIFLVFRSFGGIVKHTQTLGKVVLAELVSRDELPYIFGYYNAFANIGVIFGPAIGGRLVQFTNGCQLICLLNGILFVAQMTIFMLLITSSNDGLYSKIESAESDNPKSNIRSSSPTSLISILKNNRDICMKTTAIFCFHAGSNTLRANFPLIMQEKFNASISFIGYLNSLQSLAFAASGFLVGPIIKRYFHKGVRSDVQNMVILPAFVQVISLFGQSFATSLNFAGIFLLLAEIAKSFLWVALAAWSLKGNGETGVILGLGRMAQTSALMICPVVSGIIQSSSLSYDGPAILGGMLTLVGIFLVIFENISSRNNKED